MNTVFKDFITEVENGSNYCVDLKKKRLKLGKDYLIKDGIMDEKYNQFIHYEDLCGNTYPIYHNKTNILDNILNVIEELYEIYKVSLPSKREDDQKNKVYFKALRVEELTEQQMYNGVPRKYARTVLEAYILCSILQGELSWKDEYGKWFWQSKKDKDLIILKEWVVS